MASFKNIPITQITSTGIKDIHEHMQLKYMFEPLNEKNIKSMMVDLHFLQYLTPTSDISEDSLISAKEHLSEMIKKCQYVLGTPDEQQSMPSMQRIYH